MSCDLSDRIFMGQGKGKGGHSRGVRFRKKQDISRFEKKAKENRIAHMC